MEDIAAPDAYNSKILAGIHSLQIVRSAQQPAIGGKGE